MDRLKEYLNCPKCGKETYFFQGAPTGKQVSPEEVQKGKMRCWKCGYWEMPQR